MRENVRWSNVDDLGILLKLVIADRISILWIMRMPMSGVMMESIFDCQYAFAIQIYCDFAGYSTIRKLEQQR